MDQSATAAGHNEDAAPPPAPRALKVAVIVMGVILIVGFIAVFTTIAYRIANPRAAAPAGEAGAGFETAVAIPPGAEVTGMEIADGLALVTLRAADGSTVVVVLDPAKGRTLGRFTLQPE